LAIAGAESFEFAEVDDLGKVTLDDSYLQKHIDAILALPLVDKKAIEAANFSVVVDAVNSTGGIFVPALLEALGVKNTTKLYCDPTGEFPHNPEPLPEHLTDLAAKIQEVGADVGITVDPDVDRLALVCEDGSMFGEEYTLVAVADYVLTHTPGATVSNLSSTRALRDVTEERGLLYSAAAVGEVNVVTKMKETNAVIGGEGNGGVIYPELHYGRDSLVGIALFLSHLAHKKMKVSELRDSYPKYTISKNKIELTPDIDVDQLLLHMTINYAHEEVDTTDGVKIYIGKEWVHLRKSNTEPIIRIYSESQNEQMANDLAERIILEIKALI
jgi:phosphomannomutase